MSNRNPENFIIFSMVMDAAWITFCLAFITTIRPALSYFPIFAVIPPPYKLPWILYILFPLTWIGILVFTSTYDPERNNSRTQVLASITLGSLISGVFLAGLLYLSFRDISRFLFVLFFVLAYLGLVSRRIITNPLYLRFFREIQPRNILIIGDNDLTRELSVNINNKKSPTTYKTEFINNDLRQADTLKHIEERIVSEEIQGIVIAITEVDRPGLNDLVGRLHHLPVKVWVIPDYFQLTLHKAVISELGGIPLLDLRAPALSFYQRLFKRAFDLVVTLFSLLFFIPIMAATALWIRIDTPGPVLLRQRRVGENGTIFQMYKFRTMLSNAEELRSQVEKFDEQGNLIHKHADDPRITTSGKFLRRWSLDEIPQVFNVLKGEMSLVGPRPELPYLVDRYETWQLLRFSVPQGITGWWQVNGRSNKPMHLNTADDIYYVQNYSILLDIYILMKTIGVVILGKGAF